MKTSITNKWIITGLIWIAAVFLTYWNGMVMGQLSQARVKEELSKLDEQFFERQAEDIAKVLKKAEGLYHPVEAHGLGLLFVETELHALASKYGLSHVQMGPDIGRTSESTIPVSLSFKGFLKGAVGWLAVIEKDYPYLLVTKVETVSDQPGKEANFNVSLKYRYRIASPAGAI